MRLNVFKKRVCAERNVGETWNPQYQYEVLSLTYRIVFSSGGEVPPKHGGRGDHEHRGHEPAGKTDNRRVRARAEAMPRAPGEQAFAASPIGKFSATVSIGAIATNAGMRDGGQW